MEEAVSQRVEDALDDVSHVHEIRSDSREGLSITVVGMTEDGDLRMFFSDVERGIDAIDDFPEDVEEPVIEELGRTDLVLGVLVSGPLSLPDLKAYCEDLKDRMQEAGLPLINVDGFSEHQLRVALSEAAMKQAGLTVPMVAEAIAARSRDMPLGTVETRETDILLRLDEQRRTPAEIESLVAAGSNATAHLFHKAVHAVD